MIKVLLAALVLLLDTPAESTGARVIVQVTPHDALHGTLVEHIDGGLRIHTTDGEDLIIDPSTVLSVVHLVDCDEPRSAQLQLHSGRIVHGLLLDDGFTTIRMLVQGTELTFKRRDVAVLQVDPDIEALYRRRRALLKDNDGAGRLQLARWLMANKAWALAARELHLIDQQFNSAEARRLAYRAETSAALETEPRTASETLDDVESPPTTPEDILPPCRHLSLPGDDIVNLVRVLELDPVNPPPVRISEGTRKRLHLGWGGNRMLSATDQGLRQLLAMTDAQVLQLMFDLRARPLYIEIEVLEPPEGLQTFATDIHDRWLATRCGTRACHGGNDAGRFRLLRRSRLDDRLRTANLLQLERTQVDAGPLLNWTTPADSLLVQYALPRRLATTPHPSVPGWQPALDDDQLAAVVRWIRSMRQPRPRVDWQPEGTLDPAPTDTPPKQSTPPSA